MHVQGSQNQGPLRVIVFRDSSALTKEIPGTAVSLMSSRQGQRTRSIRGASQLCSHCWDGSFNHREDTLHQLAPYVGKLKSGMARALVAGYSEEGDVVLDPFCGSGVVPLESALLNRRAWANDLNPYAYVLTRGKLEAPRRLATAVERAASLLDRIEARARSIDLRRVPQWVRRFFHAETLRESVAAAEVFRAQNEWFLLSCLLGILHHQRPGFLSFPASHLVPYLRNRKYPQHKYPDMYEYRDVRSRLLAKVARAYRNNGVSPASARTRHRVWNTNSMKLPCRASSVDAIISSPPYFDALDYARDNRLRLWFLGIRDWRTLEDQFTSGHKRYLAQMPICLAEMCRVLKARRYCVLVLGDVETNGTKRKTAEIVAAMAADATDGRLVTLGFHNDMIPDERRSRRKTTATRLERILVMRKS